MVTNTELISETQEITDEIVEQAAGYEMKGGEKDKVKLYKSFMYHLLNDSGSYCIGFGGPRGGGKTLSMSYFASEALDWGLSVWSNYQITGRRHPERKAILLDKRSLLSMETAMQFGFLCIDEAQFLGDSRRPGSVSNLLFGYAFMQIRKNYLSILYSVKDIMWIDSRVRWETDLFFDCRDAAKTPIGKAKHLNTGEVIHMNMKDLSGQLTGKRFDETWKVYTKTLCPGHLVWPCYDTSQQVDLMEAMAGVEMDLEKIKIGNGSEVRSERQDENATTIYSALCQIKTECKMNEVDAADLWAHLKKWGVEIDNRSLGKYLGGMGVTKRQTSKGKYVYNLSGVDTTREM